MAGKFAVAPHVFAPIRQLDNSRRRIVHVRDHRQKWTRIAVQRKGLTDQYPRGKDNDYQQAYNGPSALRKTCIPVS